MGKNVVICLDGTGNQLKATGNTNVVALYALLDHSDPDEQVAYYDPGVGTFSAQGAWTPLARALSRIFGLALGSGLRTNLGEAYSWLMRNYQPGDRIYLFGFSRGAYTARALSGMLRNIGLLRPGSENLVQYAVASHTRRDKSDADWNQAHEFARIFSVLDENRRTTVPVEFMGLWDTVKAAGLLRWELKWPWTRRLPNAKTVRHAVSIDEKRRPYREYLVEVDDKGRPALEEVWFPGVHSDVGGTFVPDGKLAAISLKWIAQGAVDAGLRVNEDAYRKVLAVSLDHARTGQVHRMGRIWGVLRYRRRAVPAGAKVHASAQVLLSDGRYPADRFPPDVSFVDTDWASPDSSRTGSGTAAVAPAPRSGRFDKQS